MKKAGWLITGILVIVLIIGGIFYMKRQNDKQELLDIQKDIANYIYNNYSVYSEDSSVIDKAIADLKKENKDITPEEYAKRIRTIGKEHAEMTSIVFTRASINEMGSLVFYLTINGISGSSVTLDTLSAETNTWKYSLDYVNRTENAYQFEERETPTNLKFDESKITYYEGGID